MGRGREGGGCRPMREAGCCDHIHTASSTPGWATPPHIAPLPPHPPPPTSPQVGAHLRGRLLKLAAAYPHTIGFIHGHGLYMGIEIVRSGDCSGGGSDVISTGSIGTAGSNSGGGGGGGCTGNGARKPGTTEAKAICERMLELGIICHATGDHSNVMKVKPPLCFSVSDAECFVDTLEQVLRERQS